MVSLITIGCSDQAKEQNPLSATKALSDNNELDINGMKEVITPNPIKFTEPLYLDNGLTIYIDSVSVTSVSYDLTIRYEQDNSEQVKRKVKVWRSLSQYEIYTVQDSFLFGFNWETDLDTTKYFFNCWTGNDSSLFIRYADEIRFTIILNGVIEDVTFGSTNEYDHARWLYESFDNSTILTQSASDQALYFRVLAMAQFFSTENLFFENSDGLVLAGLSASRTFINELVLYDESDTRSLVCGIAGVVSALSCPFFLTGAAALICAPAAGISLACAIAEIHEAF